MDGRMDAQLRPRTVKDLTLQTKPYSMPGARLEKAETHGGSGSRRHLQDTHGTVS